jgi:hypothetical protein
MVRLDPSHEAPPFTRRQPLQAEKLSRDLLDATRDQHARRVGRGRNEDAAELTTAQRRWTGRRLAHDRTDPDAIQTLAAIRPRMLHGAPQRTHGMVSHLCVPGTR